MSNRITFSPRVPDSAVTLGLMKIFTTDVDINQNATIRSKRYTKFKIFLPCKRRINKQHSIFLSPIFCDLYGIIPNSLN